MQDGIKEGIGISIFFLERDDDIKQFGIEEKDIEPPFYRN